jgi:phosphatidylglycerophosphatase A
MNVRADSSAFAGGAPAQRKPRLALFIATACGLGYLPKAPGTWGSLAGVLIYFLLKSEVPASWGHRWIVLKPLSIEIPVFAIIATTIVVAFAGIYAANRVASYSEMEDPQYVVIDEVSGQLIAYTFALAPTNWKYLVLGFILFRVFDIWKPFPARQAESLSGGWGIMADDWVAGIYAAIGLWGARALGL